MTAEEVAVVVGTLVVVLRELERLAARRRRKRGQMRTRRGDAADS